MATVNDKGGGRKTAAKAIPKSISRSNMQKVEALKRTLQENLTVSRHQGFPHTLGHMTKYDIRLPNMAGKSKEFRALVTKLLIDEQMLNDLVDLGIINFCRTVQKLYPLKTAGDGNCLLHAVSMALWGIHDKAMLLRRLVYISLVEDEHSQSFQRRWERERTRLHEEVPEGFQLSSRQWATEWDMIVQASEDIKKQGQTGKLTLEFLEEIHIFVLANVIQRPIVVLSDKIVRSVHGSMLGPNNFSGIYLPLLWPPEKCSKTPVILGYNEGHFTPLVNMELAESGAQQAGDIIGEYAVPLVNKDMESLYIHFLSEEEDSHAYEFLQKYLKITEVNWTKSDGLCLVLSAKLEHNKIEQEFDLITDYIEELERKFLNRKAGGTSDTCPLDSRKNESTSKSADTKSSKTEPIRPTEKLDPQPPAKRTEPSQPEQRKVEPAPQVRPKSSPVRRTTPKSTPHQSPARQVERINISPRRNLDMNRKPCLKHNCQFFGSMEYGGYCFQCFVDSTREQPQSQRQAQEHVEYMNSMSNDQCRHANCVNMASTWTHPYCHDHARDSRLQQVAPLIHQQTEVMYVPSITDSRCARMGCKNVASTKTFPFCHEHKSQPAAQQHVNVSIPELQLTDERLGPMSATPYHCPHYGCMNLVSMNTYPYCHEHATHELPPPQAANPSSALYTSSQRATPVYEPSITGSRCKHKGCNNMASINTFPHCHEHHEQKMPALAPVRHSSLSRYETESWERAHSSGDDEPKSHSLEHCRVGPSKPCREPGCPLYGPPGYNYFCPEHHAQQMRGRKKDYREEKICLRLFCENPSSKNYGGFCSACYVKEGLTGEMATGATSWPQGEPKMEETEDPFYLSSELVGFNRQKPQKQTSHERTASLGNLPSPSSTCIAPQCQNPGSPTLKGLCGDCYSFLCQKPKSQSVAGATPGLDEDGHHISSNTLPTLLPCAQKGCDLYGRPQYDYYCYSCYKDRNNKDNRSSDVIRRTQSCRVVASKASHKRSSRHTTQKPLIPIDDQSEIARVQADITETLTNGESKGEGFLALRQIEDGVRSSRRKCRSPECNNFGNPAKLGYCNMCYH